MIYTKRQNILKSLLSFLFIFSIPLFSIGGEMELPDAVESLEKIVKDMDVDCKDKARLKQLIYLFKDSITKGELENISNTYHSLEFDCPQSSAYRLIIEDILKENSVDISCNTLGKVVNEAHEFTFSVQIDNLINAYKNIEVDKPENYGENHKKNVDIFDELKIIFSECEVDTFIVDTLSKSIVINGFGDLTKDFKTDLDDLIKRLKNGSLGVRIKTHALIEPAVSNLIESKEIVDEEFKYKDWLIIILGSVFLVLVVFLTIKIFNSKKASKDIKNSKKKRSETLREQELNGIKSKNEDLISKNKSLTNEVSRLQKKIEKLKKEKDEWQEQSKTQEILKPEPIVKSSFTPRTSTLYFATPNQNGEFISKGEENVKIGASLYKFIISRDGIAKFEFFNHPSTLKAAINDPNRLNPACKPVNIVNPNAKQIITVRQGIAYKEGNKWVVKEKAEIKYV